MVGSSVLQRGGESYFVYVGNWFRIKGDRLVFYAETWVQPVPVGGSFDFDDAVVVGDMNTLRELHGEVKEFAFNGIKTNGNSGGIQ